MRDATKWLVAAAAAVGAVLVAGLQLSSLPTGRLAVTVALSGVAVALLGIALILHRAAAVLTAGYTTLGELGNLKVSLESSKPFKRNKWVVGRLKELDRARRESKFPNTVLPRLRILGLKIYGRILRKRTKAFADEGYRIDLLIRYLNRDVEYFSNGLAENIQQLYKALDKVDTEVLQIRDATATDSPSRNSPRNERAIQDRLDNAEWKRSRLEAASATLVALANQKLLEKRFGRVQSTILGAGAAVALGAAASLYPPNSRYPNHSRLRSRPA
jgi:hypothetical protein